MRSLTSSGIVSYSRRETNSAIPRVYRLSACSSDTCRYFLLEKPSRLASRQLLHIEHRLAAQPMTEVGDKHLRAAVFIARGCGRGMRRHHDIGQIPQRRIRRQRLLPECVDRGAAEMPALNRFEERCLVDDVAACDVDEPCTFAHALECTGINEFAPFPGERTSDHNPAGWRKQFGQARRRMQFIDRIVGLLRAWPNCTDTDQY